MAIRYSGTVRVRVQWSDRLDAWVCHVSERGRKLESLMVRGPSGARLDWPVDCALAHDCAARSAIAFVDRAHDGAAWSENGIHVGRTADHAWPQSSREARGVAA